jgi:hypothetical protein
VLRGIGAFTVRSRGLPPPRRVRRTRPGLRRGEATELRRVDMDLVADATMLGCAVAGAHVHVRRRDNPNEAWAKSRCARPSPVDELLILAYDTY